MKQHLPGILLVGGIVTLFSLTILDANYFTARTAGANDSSPPTAAAPSPGKETLVSLSEAQSKARLLHETLDGALQVMHRDYFDDEKSLTIPSRSLEDVFAVLKRKKGITLRWLAVNAKAMSVDHQPENDFEKAAADAITKGEKEYELAENGTYRYAGMIRLGSECLKCHVPMRKSLEDRFAALVITMPYAP